MGENLDNMPEHVRKQVLDALADADSKYAARKRRHAAPPEDLEAAVLRECLDLLKLMNISAWRVNTGGVKVHRHGKDRYIAFGIPGQADITGLLPPNGRRLEIETKRRDGKGVQSDDQKDFQATIEASGGLYLLVESAGELHDKLKEAR